MLAKIVIVGLLVAVESETSTKMSETPDPVDYDAVVQAEKLRMNILELKEIVRSERFKIGGASLIVGLGFVGNAAYGYFLNPNAFTASRTADLSQDLSFSVFGVGLFGFGLYNVLTRASEEALWGRLERLRKEKRGDAAIYLAEGEAEFEVAVQDAVFYRKLAGALFVLAGLANFGLHLGLTLASPRGVTPDPRDPKNFLAREIIDIAAIAFGIYNFVFVKTPTERAWAAYLNDKSLARPQVTVRPVLGVGYVGLGGSF